MRKSHAPPRPHLGGGTPACSPVPPPVVVGERSTPDAKAQRSGAASGEGALAFTPKRKDQNHSRSAWPASAKTPKNPHEKSLTALPLTPRFPTTPISFRLRLESRAHHTRRLPRCDGSRSRLGEPLRKGAASSFRVNSATRASSSVVHAAIVATGRRPEITGCQDGAIQ